MTRKTNAQLLAENKKLTNKAKRLEKKAAEAESTLDIMTQQHEKDVADLAKDRDDWKAMLTESARRIEELKVEVGRLQDKVADLAQDLDEWKESAEQLRSDRDSWKLAAENWERLYRSVEEERRNASAEADELQKDRDEWKEVAEGLKDRAENLITLQRTLKDKVADLELSEAAARKEWYQWREKAQELAKDRDEWKIKEDSARLAAAKASAELFHVKEEVKKLNKDLEQCGREVNRRTTACELKDKAILNLRLKVANQRNAINGLQRRKELRVVNLRVDQDKAAEFENTGGMNYQPGTLTTGNWLTGMEKREIAAAQSQLLATEEKAIADAIIAKAVHEAIGAASMCWENINDAGEFLSNRAAEVAAALIRVIRGEVEELILPNLKREEPRPTNTIKFWKELAEKREARIAELEAQIPPADFMAPASNDPANYSSTGDIKLTLPGILTSPDEIPFGAEIGGPAAKPRPQTFKPGTVGYWLDKMDEPERSRALKNADLVLDSPARSTYSALNVFTWDKTPETGHYWLNIQRKYANKWKSQSTF